MWILAANVASAATWSVPADFATIAAAVAGATSGDRIELDPGVYVEDVVIDGKDLTIDGDGAATWVATGVASEALQCRAATCGIEGITFDGSGAARAIDVDGGGALTVEGCSFSGGSATHGGAIRAEFAASVVVRDSTFDGNQATSNGAHLYAADTPEVEVVGARMTNGTAGVDGGAIRVTRADTVVLEALWVEGNVAGDDGGGIDVDQSSSFEMRRSAVCGNSGADEGGGVVVRDAVSEVVGNLFVGNVARAGGGLMGAGNDLHTTNNHFVGNQAFDNGSGVYATGTHDSVDDLFVHHRTTLALDGAGVVATYAAFFDNDAGDTNGATQQSLFTDPLLGGPAPLPCDPAVLEPLPGSPTRDAGDPAIADLDGSRADIGAFGGSDPYPSVWVDEDGDGADPRVDCDDTDADVYPGAPERCNGIDDDCDGDTPQDEDDDDGDGFPACVDCDETNPDVHPGVSEARCNGVDDDCDPTTLDDGDVDQDALTICEGDCDDEDAAVPGAEQIGDGVDQDCDGAELCFPDEDGDGHGEPGEVWSDDVDCGGPGEAPAADDVCPGGDDRVDPDADGIPSACDPCPTVPGVDCDETTPSDPTAGDPEPGDADQDGAVDAVDPLPADAGGVAGAAPDRRIGFGCASDGGTPAWPGALVPLLALARRSRLSRTAPAAAARAGLPRPSADRHTRATTPRRPGSPAAAARAPAACPR